MQRSKPSPVWSAFFKKNTAPSYFLDVSQHVTQPSQGRMSSSYAEQSFDNIPGRANSFRIQHYAIQWNAQSTKLVGGYYPLLQRVRWWQETVPFKETRRPSAKDEEQDREYRRILLFLPSKRIFSECSIDNGLVKIYNIFVKFTNGGKEYEKILSTCTRPGNGYWHAGCRQRQGCGRRHG